MKTNSTISKEPIAATLLSALGPHLDLLDQNYAAYLQDPHSVDPSWRALFSNQNSSLVSVSPPALNSVLTPSQAELTSNDQNLWLCRAQTLILAYRNLGHLQANLDPLQQDKIPNNPELNPESYGLTDADLEKTIPYLPLSGLEQYQGLPLRTVLIHLQKAYCDVIGLEFMHILDLNSRNFIMNQIEQFSQDILHQSTKVRILEQLIAAESFERFLHTKYLGAKRFSLEGGESIIPLLDLLLEHAGQAKVSSIVFGMAHRGRLNVLTHILGKRPRLIFSDFEDFNPQSVLGIGDVKYHLGYSQDYVTSKGDSLHLSLSFNPSHLEVVNPVVMGRVRAKQHRLQDEDHKQVLGVLLHGDAAFAGQGVVSESLNLSMVRGYRTGGTIHIVINNQIGFTTSQSDSRSTRYCTDVAKMLQVPIFHVNGDHPEAVAQVVRWAMTYQQTFHQDVIIDVVCYRKYGHNESDEPSFTQPLMYQEIAAHPSVPTLYAQKLISEGAITQTAVDDIIRKNQQFLEAELAEARAQATRPESSSLQGVWQGYEPNLSSATIDAETGIPKEQLKEISKQINTLPYDFSVNPKIARLLEQRLAMGNGELPLDWGMAEALAYGSLCLEGVPVRLTGQDSRRGTFSHRQAVIIDTKTGAEYIPLQHLSQSKTSPPADFRVYDSVLSEVAVMGFEYGYSLDYPEGLTLWEAQFGDFVNGAQVVIDQYISAAESKWSRFSGLVLLLPHGWEGQGPEHSSARLERFLQNCAVDNMQVVYPTTPAQFFHLLRRQVKRTFRKPLIVMTPKSLLRHPLASSALLDLTRGQFQPILSDPQDLTASATSIVLCSGKIYYDLLEERTRREDHKTALVRLEQLYPFEHQQLASVLRLYPKAKEVILAQEEPANMGALSFLLPLVTPLCSPLTLRTVSRPAAASPATGSHKAHVLEQKKILEEVFGKKSEAKTRKTENSTSQTK